MGQQPNIEFVESDLPRPVLEVAPPRRWRPTKPGLITTPEEKPIGGSFGNIGPDPGWAQRVIRAYGLPDSNPDLENVVIGLTMARAAMFGRGAVAEDVEVALLLCGYGDDNPPPASVERGRSWVAAVPHEQRPGQTAVAEVNPDYLKMKPAQLRVALRRD